MELTVKIDGAGFRQKLARITTNVNLRRLNSDMGKNVLEKTKDHLDEMAKTRHKVADRLGAKYSKFYEYASGSCGDSPRSMLYDMQDKRDGRRVKTRKNLHAFQNQKCAHFGSGNARIFHATTARRRQSGDGPCKIDPRANENDPRAK